MTPKSKLQAIPPTYRVPDGNLFFSTLWKLVSSEESFCGDVTAKRYRQEKDYIQEVFLPNMTPEEFKTFVYDPKGEFAQEMRTVLGKTFEKTDQSADNPNQHLFELAKTYEKSPKTVNNKQDLIAVDWAQNELVLRMVEHLENKLTPEDKNAHNTLATYIQVIQYINILSPMSTNDEGMNAYYFKLLQQLYELTDNGVLKQLTKDTQQHELHEALIKMAVNRIARCFDTPNIYAISGGQEHLLDTKFNMGSMVDIMSHLGPDGDYITGEVKKMALAKHNNHAPLDVSWIIYEYKPDTLDKSIHNSMSSDNMQRRLFESSGQDKDHYDKTANTQICDLIMNARPGWKHLSDNYYKNTYNMADVANAYHYVVQGNSLNADSHIKKYVKHGRYFKCTRTTSHFAMFANGGMLMPHQNIIHVNVGTDGVRRIHNPKIREETYNANVAEKILTVATEANTDNDEEKKASILASLSLKDRERKQSVNLANWSTPEDDTLSSFEDTADPPPSSWLGGFVPQLSPTAMIDDYFGR